MRWLILITGTSRDHDRPDLRNTGGAAARGAHPRDPVLLVHRPRSPRRQRRGRGLQRQRGQQLHGLRILSPRRNPANGGCPIRSTRCPPRMSPRSPVFARRWTRCSPGARPSGPSSATGGATASADRRTCAFAASSVERGGAVVAHLDITASKRLEIEARRALHELAHMNMRAGMGELVSAVTHEMNQSLTASLGNAQALRRMLATRSSCRRTWRSCRSSRTSSTPTGAPRT